LSKKTVVEVDGRFVWMYDVARAILLAEVVAVAEARRADQPNLPADKLHDLRVLCVVGDFACTIDEHWTKGERQLVAEFVEVACARLATRPVITDAEARGWTILDQETIIWRGGPEPTGPVRDCGAAFLQLLRGTHPPEPAPNLQWFYGFPGGPQTL
jgi:hypothetical protein